MIITEKQLLILIEISHRVLLSFQIKQLIIPIEKEDLILLLNEIHLQQSNELREVK